MYKLSTSLELPMAHALEYAYSGLCKGNVYRNQTDDKTINQYSLDNNVIPVVHGHNNIITVEIGTNSPLQKSGMVLDYKLFKSIIKSHLNKYDHSLVLPVENPLVHIYKENYVKNNVKFHMSRIYPLGGNPTSEILATYWWYELYLIFYLHGVDLSYLSITFEETAHNKCEFKGEENTSFRKSDFSGIYKLTNNKTGKIYIGQSLNVLTRCKEELSATYNSYKTFQNKDKITLGRALLNALQNSTIDDWDFSILEICKPIDLVSKETFWIAFYNATNPSIGYNLKEKDAPRNSYLEKNYENKNSSYKVKKENNSKAIQRWKDNHPGARRSSDKKYEHTPCIDPINRDLTNLTNLRSRMKRNPEKYKDYQPASFYKYDNSMEVINKVYRIDFLSSDKGNVKAKEISLNLKGNLLLKNENHQEGSYVLDVKPCIYKYRIMVKGINQKYFIKATDTTVFNTNEGFLTVEEILKRNINYILAPFEDLDAFIIKIDPIEEEGLMLRTTEPFICNDLLIWEKGNND